LSQKLSRLIGIGRAKEMSFSGNFVSAELAERWGLVNRVVEPDQLMVQAVALASDMAGTVEPMMREYKPLMDKGYALPLGEALALEAECSKRWSEAISPAEIEERRREVIARGQQQRG